MTLRWNRIVLPFMIMLAMAFLLFSSKTTMAVTEKLELEISEEKALDVVGADIAVTVSFSGSSVGAVSGDLVYDSSKAELVSAEGAGESGTAFSFKDNGGNIRFVWGDASEAQNEGEIAAFYFALAEGSYETSFSLDEESITACRMEDDKIVDLALAAGDAVTQTVEEDAFTLSDGVYMIAAYKNESIVMEAAGAGTSQCTNVQLGAQKNATYQQFRVTCLGGSSYKIQNVRSGRVLDVSGNSKKSGANIQLYSWNGTAAQIFTINPVEENGKIVCELVGTGSGLGVDYAGARAESGTNVRLYTRNYTAGQKWIFIPVDDEPQGVDAEVEEGFYKIYPSKSEAFSAGIKDGLSASGLSTVLCSSEEDAGTIFKITPTADERYQITVASSGLSLSTKGKYAERSVPIVQRAASGELYDEWYIRKDSAESTACIFVCCENPEVVMDLSGGVTAAGRSVNCYPSNGTAAQRWILKESYDPDTHVLEDGVYYLATSNNSNMVMEIAGSSNNNGGNAALGKRAGYSSNQLFRISAYGSTGNLYTIINIGSGLSLDVAGNRKTAGANLQQYCYNGTDAQLFSIIPVTNGENPAYKIIGKGSGNAVDVAGGKTAAGTNIQMYTYNGTGAQRWYFYKVSD